MHFRQPTDDARMSAFKPLTARNDDRRYNDDIRGMDVVDGSPGRDRHTAGSVRQAGAGAMIFTLNGGSLGTASL